MVDVLLVVYIMKKIGLIGYSGHALVVADMLQELGFEIFGYFEREHIKNNLLMLKYLGYEKDDNFVEMAKDISLFVAIGDNVIRRRLMEYLLENKLEVVTIISRSAIVSSSANIDIGTLICNGVCINPFAIIGKGVIVNTGAIIEHECVIKDYTHIASGVVLAGNVCIGENSLIGANAAVKQGVKIGNNVTIGAGAVVLKDIPDNEVWVGNPARKLIRDCIY